MRLRPFIARRTDILKTRAGIHRLQLTFLVGVVALMSCSQDSGQPTAPVSAEVALLQSLVEFPDVVDEDGDGVVGTMPANPGTKPRDGVDPESFLMRDIAGQSLPPMTVIDFETPRLESLSSLIIDPYVHAEGGVTFTALPGYFGVVGLVKNSATSACADPPDSDQKLASGVKEFVGRSGFSIQAEFANPLPPGSLVSLEIQALSIARGVMWFYDEDYVLTGFTEGSLVPPIGTCGYPGGPRGRRVLVQESTGRVKYVVVDARVGNATNLVFVIDDFSFHAALDYALDIRPGSCPNPLNPKSRGLLPVAISGSDLTNVGMIDVNSILLEGVAPVRAGFKDVTGLSDHEFCSCPAEGPDGYLDLELKFSIEEIVAALGLRVDELSPVLHLTGNIAGGQAFELSDCVRIVGGRIAPEADRSTKLRAGD